MMNLAQPESAIAPARINIQVVRVAGAIGLAALADWLFYDEYAGLSVVIFAVALAVVSLATNLETADRRRLLPAGLILIAGLVPAVENLNALSFAFVLLALGIAAAMLTNRGFDGLPDHARALRELYLFAPFRLARDAASALNLPGISSGIAVWIVPVLMSCVFLGLFASANPLIAKWLSAANLAKMTANLSLPRILFWLLALDVIYLWGNAALPADITYASYAHRGAYPLILTALLAAGFVLIAMRPGGPAEQSKVIRPLVYLWVAQNVMMVISSILRLDLYVQTYLLTYWRVAAFIWMLLVATGLVLIVARIALQRSNGWLIRLNLIAVLLTLYACSLTNFAAIIANYNVSHSREATGKGVSIDINYLLSLGAQALPGINRSSRIGREDFTLIASRDSLIDKFRRETASWRAWGLRNWRLQHYLDEQAKRAAG